MLRNLAAEMVRHGVSRQQLADGIGLSSGARHARLYGQTEKDFSDAEKLFICNLVGMKPTEEVYEYLFARYPAA